MAVLTGKAKYKHDLMNCLAPFPQDASAGNTVVNLDTENYISCCKCSVLHGRLR